MRYMQRQKFERVRGHRAPFHRAARQKIDMDIGNFAGLASHRRNLKELSAVCAYADDGEHAVGWARQAQRIDRSQ